MQPKRVERQTNLPQSGSKQFAQDCNKLLPSYDGGRLEIVRQVQCKLSQGDYTVQTVFQVQKGAPVGLLLRINTLSALGLQLIRNDQTSTQDLIQSPPESMSAPAS